ncbi:hypothetical protein [Persicitalea sp.]|uniref:hypothetical protein n=1 Tax=Persicitalea sp. TaxID=3100273 RepID=UPI0035937F72
MENLISKYRGWLVAFCLAIAFSFVISPQQTREISNSRLQKVIEDREVASISIVESKAGIRGKYTAEITLTTAASEKYSQLTAGISSPEEGPHFVCSIGNSREEFDRWKRGCD